MDDQYQPRHTLITAHGTNKLITAHGTNKLIVAHGTNQQVSFSRYILTRRTAVVIHWCVIHRADWLVLLDDQSVPHRDESPWKTTQALIIT